MAIVSVASSQVRNSALIALIGQNMFAIAITIFGTIWVANASTACRTTLPTLWKVSVSLVALGYFQAVSSVLIILLQCYWQLRDKDIDSSEKD